MAMFDLLLMLVTLATFVDFHAGVAPRMAPIRLAFYLASCFFLCFALFCVVALDSLESISRLRREHRQSLEEIFRTEMEKERRRKMEESPKDTQDTTSKPDS
jgi:hypothetical protein